MCVCVSECHVCASTWKGEERASESLQLELQAAMSCHVGAGKGIQVLWKKSKCF